MSKAVLTASDVYKQASEHLTSGDLVRMELAAEEFARIPDYEDAREKVAECEKAIAVKKKSRLSDVKGEEKKRLTVFLVKWGTTFLVSLLVLLLAIFTPLVNAIKHNVSDIEITLLEARKEHDPYAGYSGRYYVYYDFEIENDTGADVERIDTVITVLDKAGNELGTVSTSFTTEIASGNTVKCTTTLSETRPDSNAFFTLLYDTDKDVLDFSIEIVRVLFTDGEEYSAEE